jgi:hypothetical protein
MFAVHGHLCRMLRNGQVNVVDLSLRPPRYQRAAA